MGIQHVAKFTLEMFRGETWLIKSKKVRGHIQVLTIPISFVMNLEYLDCMQNIRIVVNTVNYNDCGPCTSL